MDFECELGRSKLEQFCHLWVKYFLVYPQAADSSHPADLTQNILCNNGSVRTSLCEQ